MLKVLLHQPYFFTILELQIISAIIDFGKIYVRRFRTKKHMEDHEKFSFNKKTIRFIIYILGFVVLAIGLTLNTKSGLGVSPIISIAYAVSQITGINFGNTTLGLYIIFMIIEIIIHAVTHRGKAQIIADILQLPLSIVFTRFLNLFSAIIPELNFADDTGFAKEYTIRFLVLIAGLIFTGIGAATSLNMRLVPNPGDGIVQAVADVIGKSVGFTKNCIDVCSVAISISLSLILTGKLYGVGAGTLVAVVLVGRTIAVYNHFTQEKLLTAAGLSH